MASALAQCKSFGSSYDLIMAGWEAKENQDGVLYFVNSQQRITSWVHPYISKVFEEMGDYNNIKYAAYRTAMKLRFLQVKLGLSWISIKSIKKVFLSKPVLDGDSSSEDTISCREMFSIIYEALELSDSFRLHRNKLVQVSEIILNLILELYDTSRCGKVARRSVRIALIALCSAKLSDKYRFFFDEICNYQGFIQRGKFLYLIHDLMQITELLKESTAFGTNVSAAVNSCLISSDGNINDYSTSEKKSQDLFYSWLLQEPISIIWLPTLHRVIATETIRHNVQCCVCNTQPMVGFRYRCMQCFHYDLCQSCFFLGLFSQSHRLKHPMQEYCFPTTRKDNTKALLKIMRNKMSKRHRRTKVKLLPADDDGITGSVFQWQPRSLIPDPRGSFHSSTDSGLAAGSSDTDGEYQAQYQVAGDQAYDDNNLALMKRWCKPLEVLGEPCNTSSPCMQESLSKKNMDNRQVQMAQTIQLLEEENRILRQKLSAVLKREREEDRDSYDDSIKPVTANMVHEKNLCGDPLKEISTDIPISPINPVLKSDGQITKSFCASHFTNAGSEMANINEDREISINVLEIVGSYTPIQSTFCLQNNKDHNKNSSLIGSNKESGISDGEDAEDSSVTSSGNSLSDNVNQVVQAQVLKEDDVNDEDGACKVQNNEFCTEPHRNEIVKKLQMSPSDTETESTSNDLEYTYSDMSLSSCRTSQNSKIHGAVTFKPFQESKAEKEQGVVEDFTHDLDNKNGLQIPGVHDDDTNPDFTGTDNKGMSDFLTPDTTKNETSVELDAFKLCRMKFNRDDNDLNQRGNDYICGDVDPQPHLIYMSSTSKNKRMVEEDEFHDFTCDSFRARKIVIDGSEDYKNTPSHLHSSVKSYYPSFNLSVIPAHESSASFSSKFSVVNSASPNPSQCTTETQHKERRKTLEPVYMSTPVMGSLNQRACGQSSLRKKSALAKKVLLKQQREKENRSPMSNFGNGRSRSSSSSSISSDANSSKSQKRFSRKESASFGVTPKSSIPPSQRQRILLSMNRLQSNRSYSCNDLTFDRDVGMTTLFDRAEHHRTVGAGNQSLPQEDKDELERLIDKVRIEESSCTDMPPCEDVSNSSMLQAVMNVGDAMADFVQATAEVQLRQKESTYL